MEHAAVHRGLVPGVLVARPAAAAAVRISLERRPYVQAAAGLLRLLTFSHSLVVCNHKSGCDQTSDNCHKLFFSFHRNTRTNSGASCRLGSLRLPPIRSTFRMSGLRGFDTARGDGLAFALVSWPICNCPARSCRRYSENDPVNGQTAASGPYPPGNSRMNPAIAHRPQFRDRRSNCNHHAWSCSSAESLEPMPCTRLSVFGRG